MVVAQGMDRMPTVILGLRGNSVSQAWDGSEAEANNEG
jgi:hypothetical protein